jgi:hypothetical protein
LGALSILGFLATVSPIMHDFWNQKDPNQKQNEMIHFMKNMALLGGTLGLLGVDEPWPASVQSHDRDEDSDEVEEPPMRLSQRRMERRRAA